MNQTQQVNRQRPVAKTTPIDGPIHYVALGDSTGLGLGARDGGYVIRVFKQLSSHRPDSKLTNLCVSGATTSDVISGQLDQAVKANASLITVAIGINDIGHGITKDRFARNYDQILSTLKSKTNARILVTNIPDISSAPRIPELMRNEYQTLIVEFNKIVEAGAARHGITVFDVFGLTRRELRDHPEYFSADGFHPSDRGYQMWAEQMWPVMAQVAGVSDL